MIDISYANPLSDRFHDSRETFHCLNKWQKAATVIASIVAGILTPFILCTGAFVAFNWTVKFFDSKNQKDATTAKVESIPKSVEPVPIPVEPVPMPVEPVPMPVEPVTEQVSLPTVPQLRNESVHTLVKSFDALWNSEEKAFNEIPFDREKVSALLSEHNKLFEVLKTDQQDNFGVIYKKDLPKNSRIFVRADLHGDLKSLLENLKELQKQGLLDRNFRCKYGVHLVFLGDYMDRGTHGMEIAQILAKLRLENPEQVHLIRGNHEYIRTNLDYGNSDRHLQDMLRDVEDRVVLQQFYESMPLTVYLGESGDDSKEYVQFTHGLFEVQADTAAILDSTSPFAKMEIPRQTKLSERIQQLECDPDADYPALIAQAQTKDERKRLKLAYAAKRVQILAKMEDEGDRRGWPGTETFTAYNWADVSDNRTSINSLGSRLWRISPEDIQHCFKVASTKHKVKMLFRGHEHRFRHHSDAQNRVLVSTLPVGMDCRYYSRNFNQLDRGYMLKTSPKVKNWTKQAITREAGSSISEITETVGIREVAI